MKSKRAPKFHRKPALVGQLRLQPRDIQIIRLVYDFRFLNSDQINALVSGSEQGILRRLQKLFHYGFLDRPPRQLINPLAGTQKMVYALGDRGADLLAEKSPIDRGKIKWTEKNREVKDRHIEHTLMISNFRICLELALRNLPDVRLLFWQRENSQELKDYVYIQDHPGTRIRVPIVPDGFFAIEDPQDEMYFFSEADQGTMTNTRFLKKMKAYWHWGMKEKGHTKRFGIKTFRVLTITKTEQRKNNLRQITKQADNRKTGSLMFWFTSEENYSIQKPESILKPIWQTPKDHKWHFILEE